METPETPQLEAPAKPAEAEEKAAETAPAPKPETSWTPTPPPEKTKTFFKSLGTWLMLLVMLALGVAVLYLMSDLNHRTYRLAQVGDTMVVQKGKFLPTGFELYEPEEARLREAYTPIALPEGERVPGGQRFEDRTDLDRAMFSILAAWARDQLGSDDLTISSSAADYIQRSILLPGVSEEQRRDISVLRADLSFRKGQNLLTGIVNRLEAAAEKFKQAIEQGTSFKGEAEKSLEQVQSRIDVLTGKVPAAAPEAGPAETGNEEPQEDKPESKSTEDDSQSPNSAQTPGLQQEEPAQDVEL